MPHAFLLHLPLAARRGFTMMETLVVIGLLIILLSIFIPYLASIREANRRVTCSNNLYTILVALQSYSRANQSDFPRTQADSSPDAIGYTAFTGPDDHNPFSEATGVQLNDVSASLWLLVRQGYIIDTRVFVCPSSGDARDVMTDDTGRPVAPQERGNFRKATNLSYSYASPFSPAPGYRLNDTKRSEFALLADKNPGPVAAQYGPDAPPLELANANSRNHATVGQNVLFASGYVEFVRTPYVGVGRTRQTPGDNIYTAFARLPTTHPATQPTSAPVPIVRGYVGYSIAPASNDDSYLVPTAEDVMAAPFVRPATTSTSAPSTTRATTLSTTTAPTARPPATAPTTAPASRPASTSPVVRPSTPPSTIRAATRPATTTAAAPTTRG
jgi:type II secretory pathway pseudopilin PulG